MKAPKYKQAFTAVPSKVDFVDMEKRLLNRWKKEKTVEAYLQRNKFSKKHFSFIDGPITANNPMGLHHAWGRMYKDLFQRYKNMQGYEQRFQNGFDCQGLWVEVGVERELGFNSKKDIISYGLDKFTHACVDRVNLFAQKITEQSKRLGMFMDWENSYFTMSETNNVYVWKFLQRCHDRGLIYKSHASTVWCPRCETGLSQHEQADGYKTIDDTSVYVKFKVAGKDNEYFLAWTTTPWTLSANVLLAINTQHEYVRATVDGDMLYLAKQSAQRLGLTSLEPVDPHDLLKFAFETPYAHLPAQKKVKHFVVNWDLVDPKEGTGIVHVAPGCGAEDFDLGKEVGADITLSPLDETGRFVDGYGDMTGKYAHDVSSAVIDYLTSKGVLYKTETVTHSYPHCWRCGTKCLFRLENNWFIDIQKIRPQLKELASKARWIPVFAEKRMQDWLNNMGDWMISRKRFYGLALPFYACSCGELTVVGSREELRKLAVDPKKVDALPELHRPWIDEVTIRCPTCGKEVHRVADVGDCWLDAGAVPFSTLKYDEDRAYWKKWFPAEFICEMIEQVRLWYYSMLVYGYVFEEKIPYRNVLNYGELRNEKNERFSKSKVDYIVFDDAAEKVGSDSIRWLLAGQTAGSNVRFGWKCIEDVKRRFMLPLWNSYSYFVTYALQHSFEPDPAGPKAPTLLDRWVLAELNAVVADTVKRLDTYDAAGTCRRLEEFVVDLSTWYIRRSRTRFVDGDAAALNTLYHVLTTLCKLLAPVMPFITEEMYLNLRRASDPESVHLCDYPSSVVTKDDAEILEAMETVREVCALGQAARVESNMRVRQPLAELQVHGACFDESLQKLVAGELNVRSVTIVPKISIGDGWCCQKTASLEVALRTVIDAELKEEGMVRDMVRQMQQARKDAGLALGEPVAVTIATGDRFSKDVVEKRRDELMKAVSAKSIDIVEVSEGSNDGNQSTKDRIFVTIGS